jgi:NAD(P)-dependent dehydrogenase (short-subunit alcohol dehydrogenase family)
MWHIDEPGAWQIVGMQCASLAQEGISMDFTDKVVLITGASRGIGRAIAQRFARHGAHIAIHYNRDREAAEQTHGSLSGGSHIIVQADVAQAEAVEEMLHTVAREMGRIHVVVNNAAINEWQPILRIDYAKWHDVWQRTLDTNLVGPANIMFCVAPHMVEHGGGHIVNISSRGAFRGAPKSPAYAASKAGLNSMSQSLAQALAPHNIFVYVVAPGFVETDMSASILSSPRGEAIRQQSPLNRVGRPDEVASMVVFLASGEADFATGTIVDVNGASYLRS